MKVTVFILMLLCFEQLKAQTTVFWPTTDANTIKASQFGDSSTIFKSTTATPNPPTGFTGWTSKGIASGDPAKVTSTHWDWTRNGKGDRGNFWGTRTALASPSLANGSAIFNSDFLDNLGAGVSPTPHSGELISPIINATGYSNIVVEFNQYFRKFESECFIQYSTDGGTTWSRSVRVFPNNDLKINQETYNSFNSANTDSTKVKVALPRSVGTANFRIKFIFDGVGPAGDNQGYYFWIIDDVKLTNERYYNVRMDPFYAIPPNAYTPKEQLDTIRFLADIRNLGSVPMNNPKLQVSVWRAADGVQVYTGTNATYPSPMGLDTTYENRIVSPALLPSSLQQAGRYIGSYRVLGDSSKVDINPANDTIGFQFWVSDTSNANSVVVAGVGKSNFTKENANVLTSRVSDAFWMTTEPRSVRYGNYYRVNAEPATITSMITRLNPKAAAGRSINAAIYEWTNANGDDFVDVTERALVAGAELAIPAAVANANAWLAFKLIDINTGGNFYPKAKKDYVAVVEFDAPTVANPAADSNNIQMVFNAGTFDYTAMRFLTDSIKSKRYAFVLGKTIDSRWDARGFGDDYVPVVRLNLLPFKLTGTEKVLSGNNKMEISPNPVGKDAYLNIDVALEIASDALLRVMSVDGRLVAEQVLEKFEKQNIQLEVAEYAAGTYIVQIITERGLLTKKFVVTK